MSEPTKGSNTEVPAVNAGLRGRLAVLQRHCWLTFLLPVLVFGLITAMEPTPEVPGGQKIGLAIPYAYYPLVYTIKIILTAAAICFVWPGYREFPFRLSPLAVVVGVVGVVVWVGLCRLDVEHSYVKPLLEPIGLGWLIDSGARSGFNPFEQLTSHPGWAYGFLAVRFFGLAVVVALAEEFFLRGFLMRFVIRNDWCSVPMGQVNTASVVAATLLPMAMHPAELLAAGVWFSMVTWLYVRTRNIWDCVAAHAVTNLLLGIYVVSSGDWRLM